MESLKADGDAWTELFKCSLCGQLWRVDQVFQFDRVLAYKVKAGQNWLRIDKRKMQEAFCIREEGGLSQEKCVYRGCENFAINGTRICVAHKYFRNT